MKHCVLPAVLFSFLYFLSFENDQIFQFSFLYTHVLCYKMNLDGSEELRGGAGSMKKRKAVTQAIYREKKKVQSISEAPIPKTSKDIKENLNIKYQTTSTKLMLVFMSEFGKDILGRSETMYCDGTFATAPEPFKQIFFVMGQMPGKRPIICAFSVLPDKEFKTYKKNDGGHL